MSDKPQPIPAYIDHLALLRDLNDWGWRDYKLEAACGFSVGYVAWLRKHPEQQRIFYPSAARLYNLWVDEQSRHPANYEPAHSFSLSALSA